MFNSSRISNIIITDRSPAIIIPLSQIKIVPLELTQQQEQEQEQEQEQYVQNERTNIPNENLVFNNNKTKRLDDTEHINKFNNDDNDNDDEKRRGAYTKTDTIKVYYFYYATCITYIVMDSMVVICC